MTQNKFLQAMYQTKLLYDVSFNNEDDFCEIALIAWNLIGNKTTKLYRYFAVPENGEIDLPCNCDIIEAVLAPTEDWNYTTNLDNDGSMESYWIEQYIDDLKNVHHPLYAHGHFIHYKLIGNKMYFNNDYSEVLVIYKGIELDEDGLPYLNDKELMAICNYVAYISTFKKALASNNQSLMQTALQLEKKWYISLDLARSPMYLSLNEFNEILDVKSSWNRKLYGKSYKALIK